MKTENLRVLTLIPHYLPGYKGGGPIRSIANMVDQLGDQMVFKLLTMDRDAGDSSPYSGVIPGAWTQLGKGEVMYLPPEKLTLGVLREILNKSTYDVLYLNSFFSPGFTIKPLLLRWFGLIPNVPVILAPRGEFSPGALALKSLQKLLYIHLSRLLGLFRDVVWQASSEYESVDIQRSIGVQSRIIVAPNVRTVVTDQIPRKTKVREQLTIIFLSRISRKKNLDGALRVLKRLHGAIYFNIYGPIEDSVYWNECQDLIADLPINVTVRYQGSVEHVNVGATLAKHDVFFFPTHGENFGHVIHEALLVGTPVLISDQTPWKDLKTKHVGWDLPLASHGRFEQVLQELVWMDAPTHSTWCENASTYGKEFSRDDGILVQNRDLFQMAIKDRVQNSGQQ